MNAKKRHGSIRVAGILLLASLAIGAIVPDADAFGRRTYSAPPCDFVQPCVTIPTCNIVEFCCETEFKSGNELENLQVRIVGSEFDAIEIYLHSSSQNRDEFARDIIAGAEHLNCHPNSVLLAPSNPYGTFAVRYGHHQDAFKVYGWKKTATSPEINPSITLAPGEPVHLEWVTPRILKATAGDRELVLRFNDSDTPWSVLYKSP